MARITIEDCVKVIPNRFDLCLVGSMRAKHLLSGSETVIKIDSNEKVSVIALRELAENLLDVEKLKGDVALGTSNQAQNQSLTNEIIDHIDSEGEGIVGMTGIESAEPSSVKEE